MLRLNKNILSLALLFVSLLLIYSPVLTHQYLFHDDVNFFTRTPARLMPPSQLFNFFVGRYFGAVFMTLASWSIHFVNDLTFIRFFSILNISIVCFVLYRFLRDYFQNRIHTFLTVLLIGMLPGFQVMASYAGIFFHTIAASLASIAAYLVLKIPSTKPLSERLSDKFAILAMLLLFSAISTYASTAMFYWVFVLIILLSSVHKPTFDLKIKLVNFYLVGVISLAIYATVLRLLQKFSLHFMYGMYNPYQMNFDLVSKLKWFIKEPLLNILNLWRVFPTYSRAVILLTFILISAVVNIILLYRQRKEKFDLKQTSLSTIIVSGVLASLILLSFLPSLMATGESPFYRCTLNLAAMTVVLLVWSLDRWLDWILSHFKSYILTFLLILLCFYASLRTYNNIFFLRILPSQVEFNFVKDKISQADLNRVKRIHIIEPRPWMVPERYDEFVTPTTRYSQDMVGLVTTALIEKTKGVLDISNLKYDPKTSNVYYVFKRRSDGKTLAYKTQITSSIRETAPTFTEDFLVIDINELYYPGAKLFYLTQ